VSLTWPLTFCQLRLGLFSLVLRSTGSPEWDSNPLSPDHQVQPVDGWPLH
jgi:hypothetical protein